MFIGTTVLDLPAFFVGLLCACSKAACAFRTAPGGGPLNRFIAPNLRRSMADPYTHVGEHCCMPISPAGLTLPCILYKVKFLARLMRVVLVRARSLVHENIRLFSQAAGAAKYVKPSHRVHSATHVVAFPIEWDAGAVGKKSPIEMSGVKNQLGRQF